MLLFICVYLQHSKENERKKLDKYSDIERLLTV